MPGTSDDKPLKGAVPDGCNDSPPESRMALKQYGGVLYRNVANRGTDFAKENIMRWYGWYFVAGFLVTY